MKTENKVKMPMMTVNEGMTTLNVQNRNISENKTSKS